MIKNKNYKRNNKRATKKYNRAPTITRVVHRPLRNIQSFTSDLSQGCMSFTNLYASMTASLDYTHMTSVYKRFRIKQIKVWMSFNYPFSSPGLPVYVGYNPNTVAAPPNVASVADLQNSRKILNTMNKPELLIFKPTTLISGNMTTDWLDSTANISLGSIQVATTLIGTAPSQSVLNFEYEYDIEWNYMA